MNATADLCETEAEAPAPTTPPSAIVVERLARNYGDYQAVRGISFSVERGEIFGLLGPNGAGKSTTLSMLSGILPPTSGVLRVNGYDMTRPSNEAKRSIGVVPQALAIYPILTARDNLEFFGRVYGLRGPRLRARISAVLDIVGLQDRADHVVDTYSGGMKRRLNFAAAILHEPRVVLMDEPTVGVDPQSRNAIFDAIERMHEDGVTIIYTTHYMEEAERLCRRVAIVDEGRIIALDSPSALCREFGGQMIRARLAGDSAALTEALQREPSVRSASCSGSWIEIQPHSLAEAMAALCAQASRRGTLISDLKTYESSLETVFLKLTGKQLRDDP
jgi:ABC-2 type transport system ATP-binding protein